MIERFRQLAPREQIILGGGAALAVIIIAWSFVWTPLQNTVNELRESVGERSRLMVDLRRAASLGSTMTPGAATANAQGLTTLINATASPLGLASAFENTNLQGADSNTISVALENASFRLIVDWLIALNREHGISVDDVNLFPASSGQPGMVRGRIVLSRS